MNWKLLENEDLEKILKELPSWSVEQGKLIRAFSFADFRQAMAFLVRVSFEAETLGHHPEIYNVYNKVRIQLSTHEAGDRITSLDIELAQRIDAL